MTALVLIVFLAPIIAAALSIASTLIHTYAELADAGAPIWQYLRLPVSDLAGLIGLIGFAAVQIGLAVHSYGCGVLWAIYVLAAIRIGDCMMSHWLPWLVGRRPNPGLATTPLYAVEAVLILAALGL